MAKALKGTVESDDSEKSGEITRFDPAREERMCRIWDMKVRGLTADIIADTLNVSVSTVYSDVKELGRRYREQLEKVDPVTLLAENLQWLDEIERSCLFEAAASGKVTKKIQDAETDQTVEFEINDPNKAKFMQVALNARREKVKLLLDTGVIPKDPEKMTRSLKSLKKAEDKIESRSKRSEEEMEESIENLLTYGRRV